MKKLTTDELVALLPPTPQQLEDGLARFELSAPICCREPGYIKQLIAEGWMEASVVSVGGRPAFFVAWHVTPDQGFWFDVVVTLGAEVPYTACATAIEGMARERGCRYIRWVTLRRGIVHWAKLQGYTAEAVILTKKL